jgi:hypothetical protein
VSFCNTNEISRRLKMVGFAMHCSALSSRLLDLKNRRGIDQTPAGDQYRMFQLTNEERGDFAEFAANLRFLVTPWTNERSEEYWQESGKHEYTDYEFHQLFDPFQRDKTELVVALLERIGNGELLDEDETKAAMDFLRMLSARAHANTDHGGCF